MAATHQSHNIPWQVLAEVYVLGPEHARFLGGGKLGTTLNVRDDWPADRVFKAARHFARRLARAVQDFAQTERLKYPPCPPSNQYVDSDRLVYKDDAADTILITGPYRSDYQTVDGWKRTQGGDYGRFYSYNGDYVCAARQLLHRGMLDSLLLLAHKGVRLDTLDLGIEPELQQYITLNVTLAMDAWSTIPRLWPAQLRSIRDNNSRSSISTDTDNHCSAAFYRLDGPALQDALAPHLSHLFRCLYLYHVAMAECGSPPDWECEALCSLPLGTSRIREYADELRLLRCNRKSSH